MEKPSIITGRHPLIEAITSGLAIDKILFQRNVSGESIGEIRMLAKKHNIPIQQVPAEKMDSISKANHQGVLAFAALVSYLDLQQVINHVAEAEEIPLFLILDGITDVRNIGAIARSALCCGAQAIIIPDKGVGSLNEEAMKSSAGALGSIRISRVGSLLKAVDILHLNGIRVFTTTARAEKNLSDVNFEGPSCIIMGSEDRGVQPYLIKAADECFSIPMRGSFDSFNVSVAAGIILYEAMKQRI
jgi:23S rRNA (guanosine2251-2'-O)-methyltransferase